MNLDHCYKGFFLSTGHLEKPEDPIAPYKNLSTGVEEGYMCAKISAENSQS